MNNNYYLKYQFTINLKDMFDKKASIVEKNISFAMSNFVSLFKPFQMFFTVLVWTNVNIHKCEVKRTWFNLQIYCTFLLLLFFHILPFFYKLI